jgi:hypothetical protein
MKLFTNFTNKYTIKEIKYFSTNGDTLPNGHQIQKAGFIKECNDNSDKFKIANFQYFISKTFELVEALHPEQYGLADYRGGIITFSTDVNAVEFDTNKIINFFKKVYKSIYNRFFAKSKVNNVINKYNDENVEEYIGAFSIGNFFSGRYIGDSGKMFDEKSLSVEINGISTKALFYFAEEIAKEFEQETVLVKDLNADKIFLVDKDRDGSYDLTTVNKKV